MIWNTMGYHACTLGHDVMYAHQGPQYVRRPPLTPPAHVEVPKVVRPQTQLGFELRARRRNADWGLGEAGRQRKEAGIAINKRFPPWGRVDGAVLAYEKPSAVEALEALNNQKRSAYHAGEGKKKHMYKTVKDLTEEEEAAASGVRGGSPAVHRSLPPLAQDESAAQRAVARAAAADGYDAQRQQRQASHQNVAPITSSSSCASSPTHGVHGHMGDARRDPRIRQLAKEMRELAGVTTQLATFREERLGTLAAGEVRRGGRLPFEVTRERRTILDPRRPELTAATQFLGQVAVAAKVNRKLEAAMAEKTARCVALSGELTAEYGDLSNLM